MRIKDNLILREVAGQYVIVPIGKRVNEITSHRLYHRIGSFFMEQASKTKISRKMISFI